MPPILRSARPSAPLKARPGLELFESRDVPSTVTVAAVAGATEGGAAGTFRYTRDGSVSGSATIFVTYSSGSTATPGSDYGVLSSQVSFAPGSATVDVTVTPVDDGASEPTEVIVATILSGGGMTIGSPGAAPLSLFDNDAQVVTVAEVNDATEGGASGTFRFTRTGDLSSASAAHYTVGGTATSGTDFTALGGTVTFAANAATADVSVAAATDTIYDPDETVAVTVASGTGYTIGTASSDTVTIADNVETVETLIHQQTFQLTGANGNVNVALTVTYNAPGAQGVYTWVYTVTNPIENSDSLTSFEVPIDGMDSDVSNLASSLGWTGTIGTAGVSWAAGTALAPGATATFSFTTLPREIGDGPSARAAGVGSSPTCPPHRRRDC